MKKCTQLFNTEKKIILYMIIVAIIPIYVLFMAVHDKTFNQSPALDNNI